MITQSDAEEAQRSAKKETKAEGAEHMDVISMSSEPPPSDCVGVLPLEKKGGERIHK